MVLSTKISATFDKKLGELLSTNKKVYTANVYPPKNEHSVCCVG